MFTILTIKGKKVFLDTMIDVVVQSNYDNEVYQSQGTAVLIQYN